MRKSRAFRSSVVTVFAAFAPAAGCADDGGKEVEAACPAARPNIGDPCVTGLSCGYERCGNDHFTYMASCVERKFQVNQVSCNPPWDAGPQDAMADPVAECPIVVPSGGQACAADLRCVYERCLGAHPTLQAVCVDGAVQIWRTSCNPPWDSGPPVANDAQVDAQADAQADAQSSGG